MVPKASAHLSLVLRVGATRLLGPLNGIWHGDVHPGIKMMIQIMDTFPKQSPNLDLKKMEPFSFIIELVLHVLGAYYASYCFILCFW